MLLLHGVGIRRCCMASASNQSVGSRRRRSDSSYAVQFRPRPLVLYFGVTLLCVRAAIVVVSRGLASERTVGLGGPEGQEAEPCTNAPLQRRERLGGLLNHYHRRAA